MKDLIAVVFDFDDTLTADSTSGFLEFMGTNAEGFWKNDVDPLLEQGWDPVPAYLYRMIELSRKNPPERKITRDSFRNWGAGIKFYSGVSSLFKTLDTLAAEISRYKGLDIGIEYYIISTGIHEIINASRIQKHFTQIWACDFHYNSAGEIDFPKNVISFTDKTRYLFHIAKGIIGEHYIGKPFEVNRKIPPEQYRIPFNRIIFVGDGYTDIPCFSLLQKNGGVAIGVYDRGNPQKRGKAWGFVEDGRVSNLAAADYRKGYGLHDSLALAVESIAGKIALSKKTYAG